MLLKNNNNYNKSTCTMTGIYWSYQRKENIVKALIQEDRRNIVILHKSKTFSPRNEKVLTETGTVVYILPNTNTQNTYNEAWNDTFDVFLPFAIIQEELWTILFPVIIQGHCLQSTAFSKLGNPHFTFDIVRKHNII